MRRVTKAFEREVNFEIDGLRCSFATWSTVGALRDPLLQARSTTPRLRVRPANIGRWSRQPTRLCVAIDVARWRLDRQRIAAGSLTRAREISAAVRTTIRTSWS